MTSRERAYETARKWMPNSEPDSMKLCALMCHIELAIDAAVAEAASSLGVAVDRVLAAEGDGTKAYASVDEVGTFYRALQDLRIARGAK